MDAWSQVCLKLVIFPPSVLKMLFTIITPLTVYQVQTLS